MNVRGGPADLMEATRSLATPFVAVDTQVMASNLAAMQSECERRRVNLRPHVKTHKSSFIARLQIAAGATGLASATLSEAIGLANADIATEMLVAIPIFMDAPKASLAREAAAGHRRLLLAADSLAIADSIAAAGLDTGRVGIMVEVDSGLGRTGLNPAAAGALARHIENLGGPPLAGFFTHGGHGYIPGTAPQAGADERSSLAAALDSFGSDPESRSTDPATRTTDPATRTTDPETRTTDPATRTTDPATRTTDPESQRNLIVSAGSTPTALLSADPPVNEERPGTYVFGDVQQIHLGQTEIAGVAAAVIATVIHSGVDRYVVDAGAKILTKDRPAWTDSYGMIPARPGDVIDRVYDNHGVIVPAGGTETPPVGARIMIIPNHICPVVNLVDSLAGFDPATGRVTTIAVDLRGHLT